MSANSTLENVIVANAYSLAPLVVLEPLVTMTQEPLPGLAFCIKVVCVIWASRSASLALVSNDPAHERKVLLFVLVLVLFFIYMVALRDM